MRKFRKWEWTPILYKIFNFERICSACLQSDLDKFREATVCDFGPGFFRRANTATLCLKGLNGTTVPCFFGRYIPRLRWVTVLDFSQSDRSRDIQKPFSQRRLIMRGTFVLVQPQSTPLSFSSCRLQLRVSLYYQLHSLMSQAL